MQLQISVGLRRHRRQSTSTRLRQLTSRGQPVARTGSKRIMTNWPDLTTPNLRHRGQLRSTSTRSSCIRPLQRGPHNRRRTPFSQLSRHSEYCEAAKDADQFLALKARKSGSRPAIKAGPTTDPGDGLDVRQRRRRSFDNAALLSITTRTEQNTSHLEQQLGGNPLPNNKRQLLPTHRENPINVPHAFHQHSPAAPATPPRTP